MRNGRQCGLYTCLGVILGVSFIAQLTALWQYYLINYAVTAFVAAALSALWAMFLRRSPTREIRLVGLVVLLSALALLATIVVGTAVAIVRRV
jgi:hypothetical protein